MKSILYYIGFFAVLLLLVPLLALLPEKNGETRINQTGEKIAVYNVKTDKVEEYDLEEYVKGVVAAEMPATFEEEALKAQAVAARTYTVKKVEDGNAPSEHKGAPVCTDSAHCKAFLTKEEAENRWGKNKDAYEAKITEAVNRTQGKIMVYQDEPITAVFHSMSSGKTENSKDVWGGDLPYLTSVESPGDVSAPNYETEVMLSFQEFQDKLKAANPEINVQSMADIGPVEYTEAGSVKTIVMGGVPLKGSEVRTIFNLRSAAFSISEKEDGQVCFSVKGYGHGVGMSQYGANYFAQQGMDYQQILKTYYQGVQIVDRVV